MSLQVSDLLAQALLALNENRLEDASRHCAMVLAINSKNLEAQRILGVVAAKQGRYAQAKVIFNGILWLHPKCVISMTWLAVLLTRTGDEENAQLMRKRAVETMSECLNHDLSLSASVQLIDSPLEKSEKFTG